MPLAILFGALFVGLTALERDIERKGVAQIDATRYRLQSGTRWVSPAWRAELESLLVSVRELSASTPAEIDDFVQRLAALPFVAEVGTPEVQWPDGLSVPIRMHEPTACVATGERDFLPVSSEGHVLGGYAFAPHEAFGGWLPALRARAQEAAPGDVLETAELLDALSVADTMWLYLDGADRRRIGRILIDATASEAPVFDREPGSISPPMLPGGVFLALEDGRRIYFGRPPRAAAPGELPVSHKWRLVSEALADAEGGADWRLLDVRFDRGVRLGREEVEAFAARGIVDLDTYEDPFERR